MDNSVFMKLVASIVGVCSMLAVAFTTYHHLNDIHEAKGAAATGLNAVVSVVSRQNAASLYWLKEQEKTRELDDDEKARKLMLQQSNEQFGEIQGALKGE